MENKSPPKINLAKLAKTTKSTKRPRNRIPMTTDRNYNASDTTLDPTRQLISPPPEETLTLRRVSGSGFGSIVKRKRNDPTALQPVEATPNPKPRKQTRHTPPLAGQPSRAASGSPIKRKRNHVAASSPLRATEATPNPKPRKQTRHTQVKKELPDIDLSAPMPPASPTDDPLLLLGSTPVRPTAPSVFDLSDLPSSSVGWSDSDEELGAVFNFNGPPDGSGGWSDSDDDEECGGVGEYTGRWTMMKVKTKADPPSSGTRRRLEEWGRPVSPFPGRSVDGDEDGEDDDEAILKPLGMLDFLGGGDEDEPDEEVEPEADIERDVETVQEAAVQLAVEVEETEVEQEIEAERQVEIQQETAVQRETEVEQKAGIEQEAEIFDSDGEDSDTFEEVGVVRITSADPKAAARAAAILKQVCIVTQSNPLPAKLIIIYYNFAARL